MPNDETDGALLLPDLRIRNFRGIREIDIPRLGRVTLITGKNSVGKTTILEACRVYAEGGRLSVLRDLMEKRDEYIEQIDEDGDRMYMPDLSSIFFTQGANSCSDLEIGPRNGDRLKIEIGHPSEEEIKMLEHDVRFDSDDFDIQIMRVFFKGPLHSVPLINNRSGQRTRNRRSRFSMRWRGRGPFDEGNRALATNCVSLGPGVMENDEVAVFMDRVALTEDEDRAVDALRTVLGDDVERIAMVGHDKPPFRGAGGRRAVVKLKNRERPVSLKSLGDGATRFLCIALALANCRDGFLLIDEAENGIHYTVQADYWRLVFNLAERNNVQVLATTHSWDCVEGFAQAAVESEASDGFLFRVGRNVDRVWPIGYSERELQTVAEQGIEVR